MAVEWYDGAETETVAPMSVPCIVDVVRVTQ